MRWKDMRSYRVVFSFDSCLFKLFGCLSDRMIRLTGLNSLSGFLDSSGVSVDSRIIFKSRWF